MWDRFYDNSSNLFANNSTKTSKVSTRESFYCIETTIELAWEQPDLKERLVALFEKKLKEM